MVSGSKAFYYCTPLLLCPSQINDTLVIKSGSDFRDFSEITVNFLSIPPTFDVVRHTITSDVPPDPEVAAIVDNYCASMQEMMKEQIGRLVIPLWPLYSPTSPHIQCI